MSTGLFSVLQDVPLEVAKAPALLAIIGARPLGYVLVHPIFGRYGIRTGFLRGAVIFSMSMFVLPAALAQIDDSPRLLEPATAMLFILSELIIGAFLGLIIGIPFWVVMAAGDFFDNQRGASMANVIDPQSSHQVSLTGTFLVLTSILFLCAEGVMMPAIFGPFIDSYRVFPVMTVLERPDTLQATLVLDLLGHLLRAGLVLALPLIIPLLLVEMVLAISVKNLQQINVMFLAMSVKQALGAFMMLIYTLMLVRYGMGKVGKGDFGIDSLAPFLKGTVP